MSAVYSIGICQLNLHGTCMHWSFWIPLHFANILCLYQVVSWQNIVMDANFILYWNMSINFAWNVYTLIEHTAYHCICHDKSTSYRVCIKTTSISSDMNCISGPAGRSIPNMYDHEDIDRGNWPGNGTIWLLIIIARAERIKYLYYVWSISAWWSCLSLLTFDQSAMSYATNVFVWFLDK